MFTMRAVRHWMEIHQEGLYVLNRAVLLKITFSPCLCQREPKSLHTLNVVDLAISLYNQKGPSPVPCLPVRSKTDDGSDDICGLLLPRSRDPQIECPRCRSCKTEDNPFLCPSTKNADELRYVAGGLRVDISSISTCGCL